MTTNTETNFRNAGSAMGMRRASFGLRRGRMHFDEAGNGGDGPDADAERAAAEEAARKAAEEAEKNKKNDKPSDKEAQLLKDVMKHKDAAKAAKEELDRLSGELKKFEGIDPEKVKELLAQQAQAEADKKKAEEEHLRATGEWDRLKEMMANQHKEVVDKITGELTTTKGQLEAAQKQIEDLTVGQNFATSDYLAKETVLTPSIARAAFGAHFDVENGVPVAYDKPRGAKDRTPLVDAAGKPLAFNDAMKKIIESSSDKDKLLRSTLKPGAGAVTEDVRTEQQRNSQQPKAGTGLARITASLEGGAFKKK